MNESLMIPISEHFHSIQGEGRWTGTPMHFIRLAGCSVGVPQIDERVRAEMDPQGLDIPLPVLRTGRPAWLCHTYDGRPFWCDTDFNLYNRKRIDELMNDTWEKHICVSGGEPFIHAGLEDLVMSCAERGKKVHFETSGTILRRFDVYRHVVWITVSPKLNFLDQMIEEADEIKLLVDKDFSLETVPKSVLDHPLVYVQPINRETEVDQENVALCARILREIPHWHLSLQIHKFIGWR